MVHAGILNITEDTNWMTKALDELLTLNDELSDPDPDILSMVSRNISHTQMPGHGQCRSLRINKTKYSRL